MTAREPNEGIRRAAVALAHARATNAQLTPREQAERAWTPASLLTVDQLEDKVRELRGLPPRHHVA